MDAAAELGRNPVSKHQIQPEYGDEQADAGRDGWTRLARPNSQARTRTGEYSFSLFSWPRAGLATLPGWSILCYMWWPYIHTYIHTCCRESVGTGLVVLKAVRVRGAAFASPRTKCYCAPLFSHTHYWYTVSIFKLSGVQYTKILVLL